MRRSLISTSKFEKSYRKIVRSNNFIQKSIDNALKQLEEDAFSLNLATHRLYGNLYGLFACTCGYDCRIVFSFQKDIDNKKESIILIDIGTHEEVY
jgi:mRNA interferase YafQ